MTEEPVTGSERAYMLELGEGHRVPTPSGGSLTFKVTGAETGGMLLVFESSIPPGEGPPLHVHADMDEVIYVLDGKLRVRLGTDLHQALAGACVFIPHGVAHAWQTVGAAPVRFLVVASPAGLEHFFERTASEGLLDQTAFSAFGREVGMEVVGPPLSREETPQSGA
jgi:quercetin dioxygenase-like cupin family protein